MESVFADGARVGWFDAVGVHVFDGEAVRTLRCEGVLAVSAHPNGWTIVCGEVGRPRSALRMDPAGGERDRRDLPLLRAVVPGAVWLAVRAGARWEVLALDDRGPATLPQGAREMGPRPWTDAPGLVWAEMGTAYRMGADGRTRAAGAVHHDQRLCAAGPGGSAVFGVKEKEGPRKTWGMAAGRPPVELEDDAVPEDARFDADGTRAMLRVAGGVAVFDLREGTVLGKLERAIAPVGFAPEALLFDAEAQTLVGIDGTVIRANFAGPDQREP